MPFLVGNPSRPAGGEFEFGPLDILAPKYSVATGNFRIDLLLGNLLGWDIKNLAILDGIDGEVSQAIF